MIRLIHQNNCLILNNKFVSENVPKKIPQSTQNFRIRTNLQSGHYL